MSKFKRTRDDKNPIITPIESKIIHGADEVVQIEEVKNEAIKLVTVPLTHKEHLLLAELSEIEDRSQRKISGRLLGKALQELALQKGLEI